jgi:Putative DNA-binding domain
MDSSSLRKLVWQPAESAKLDFKIEPYKIDEPKPITNSDIQKWAENKEQQWAELTKDIIALANGNVGTAEEIGYLIIGAGDKLGADNKPTLRNVRKPVPTRTEILQKVNSYCNPKIPDLQCEEFMVDNVNLFVISIPPSPYLYRLSKQLKPPKLEYSPHVVLIRRKDGENTYVASPDEIEAIENEKNGGTRFLPPWKKLEIDLENVRKITKQKLRKKAWQGYFIILVFLVAIFSIFIALLSNAFAPIILWYHVTVQKWCLIAIFSVFPILKVEKCFFTTIYLVRLKCLLM